MSDPRTDAPHAARLFALAFATSGLFAQVCAWQQRRVRAAFEQRGDPDFATLEALGQGQALLELLLAALVVLAAVRYARAFADPLARYLSLGAGAIVALELARHFGLGLHLALADDPSASGVPEWWWLLGTCLHLGGVGLLFAAVTRGERLRRDPRTIWPLVLAAGLIAIDLAIVGLMTAAPDLRGWSSPIYFATMVCPLVGGLLVHAERISDDTPTPAWARAAVGVERYRDATATRVLLGVAVVAFLFMARLGRFSPHITLTGMCLLLLVGSLLGLAQLVGLVRVLDAPRARAGLYLALTLLGLALAGECTSLAPVLAALLDDARGLTHLARLDLPELALASLSVALLATLTLLLAFAALARGRGALDVARRCHVLLAALVILGAAIYGFYAVVPGLGLAPRTLAPLTLGFGALMLAAAVAVFVGYLRMLLALRDAMLRPA